jgi:CHAT domain-containing protein/tetratricopeptide (TPR) repeat protein
VSDLQNAILAFLRATHTEERRRCAQEYPELLSAEAVTLLERMAWSQEDQRVVRVLEEAHRDLLGFCRERGVDVPGPESPPPAAAEDAAAAEAVPPGFGDYVGEMRRLQQEAERDPRAHLLVVRIARRILARLPPGEHPTFRAGVQRDLGRAYHDLREGDRGENLAQAMACYQEALGVYTRDAAPEEFAAIQTSLGIAYTELPAGNRADNLARAIACYREALRIFTPKTGATEYATVQNNLGNAYSQLPTGDQAANLEQAIACYREALRFRTPQSDPLRYALTQVNLGGAYRQLTRGDRAANLEQAIGCYQEAIRFLTSRSAPRQYALTQHNLGAAYCLRAKGDLAANLARGIACFEEALRFVTPETDPWNYALIRSGLGNAYRDLPSGDRGANIERAIECYQDALRLWTLERAPRDYARTQSNLGIAYLRMLAGDRAVNLKRALRHFRQALRVWKRDRATGEYAETQGNLGLAYTDLPTGDRGANLTRAIACFGKALRVWTPRTAPAEYANAQTNLGNAYLHLPTGDRSANLGQAIDRYREALRFCTAEADPLGYAKTMHNLGAAYSSLPGGDRGENLRRAIDCYTEALRFRTPDAAPREHAMTLNNLGTTYAELPAGDRTANLREAIECFQESLRFRTPEAAPFDHALTQLNLGTAWSNLPDGDRAANLRQAINCFQEALRFFTPEAAPLEYAQLQNNLGTAYADLPGEDANETCARAVACYREALRFRTPEAAPFGCRQTSHNLADLYLRRDDWPAAHAAYRLAIDAGERLYWAGRSSESKAVEIAVNARLYQDAAFASAQVGDAAGALLTLEEGKTRVLADTMRLGVPRPEGVPDEAWGSFQEAAGAVRALQVGIGENPRDGENAVDQYARQVEESRTAEERLRLAIEGVRRHYPAFLQTLDLAAVRGLLPDDRTALVALCVTGKGSLGLVVGRGADPPRLINVPGFGRADLNRLLFGEAEPRGEVKGGWVRDYLHEANGRWHDTLERVLAEVGLRLLSPVLAALAPGVKRLLVLPPGELFLLPLHAAPLAGSGEERVCDRYEVNYAPSAEVLTACRARTVQANGTGLYALSNPEEDPRLPMTRLEILGIAGRFGAPRVDQGRAGTREAVAAGVRGRAYLHFACHGRYDWADPRASGLTLADGRLNLADLLGGAIDLSGARLATLSACETGVTDVLTGSAAEYVGLPAGFLIAGVPCVVSSLWAVNDLSTALLMGRFYANHLAGGMSLSGALHEAQGWTRGLTNAEVARHLDGFPAGGAGPELAAFLVGSRRYYRRRGEQDPAGCPFTHPYYWAPFTLYGYGGWDSGRAG